MGIFFSRGALQHHTSHSDWGKEVRELLSEGIHRPKKGHDAGDHPPITPMRAAERGAFDHDSWRIYEYIVKHFIGSVRHFLH